MKKLLTIALLTFGATLATTNPAKATITYYGDIEVNDMGLGRVSIVCHWNPLNWCVIVDGGSVYLNWLEKMNEEGELIDAKLDEGEPKFIAQYEE